MGTLNGKTAIVTGASRGVGRAIALRFAREGARVAAVARSREPLDALAAEHAGIEAVPQDVAASGAAAELYDRFDPDLVVLAAGATPTMAPIHQQTWDSFTAVWNTDVRQTFQFCQQALTRPLRSGARILVYSSGAGLGGSPLSGGYSGAKRMQMFLTQFCRAESGALERGLTFQCLVPKQIMPDTALGRAAAAGYAEAQGITVDKFVERFGTPLTPELAAQHTLAVATGAALAESTLIGMTGEGVASLD